jgi:cellulose synthase/poly-beta-1,6-N-acetylglucosamine synthase-like glycosyltransferase
MIIQLIFWFSTGVLLYVYIGYPLLIILFTSLYWNRLKRSKYNNEESSFTMPIVSLVMPARNEEMKIRSKLENSLELDYPKDKFEIIVASDGSTDRTNEIVTEYADRGVKLVVLPGHSGKSAAQNAAVSQTKGDIIVFSDATGMYNRDAIKKLIRRFLDPRVGCVTGRVFSQSEYFSQAPGTNFFRLYESFIRSKESILGNLSVATGSIFAIRRNIFEPLNTQLSDDFILPLKTIKKGYRVVQEPLAMSFDDVNPLTNAFRRWRQIVSKDFRTLMSIKEIFNPFRFPLVAWGLLSHKLLRWTGAVFLFLCFISSVFLVKNTLFLSMLTLQIIFYGMAITGWIFKGNGRTPKIIHVTTNFCISNIAALIGIIDHFRGKETGRWEPSRNESSER